MSPFLQFALLLAALITAAKLGGYLSLRLGQPSVLGELLAGLLLGPTLLDLLQLAPFTDLHLGESIAHLAELGVLLLMFIAGLDLHISDLARSGKVAALAGGLGVLLPVALGYGAGRAFALEPLPAVFVGLVLAATSVSISAQTLMELKVLRSRVGISLLGAAVLDDVLVVLGLSVLVALTSEGGGGLAGVGLITLRMLLFLGLGAGLGLWLLPRLSRRVDRLPISQGLIAFTFVAMLLFAWAAEVLGSMAAITGAFLAGLVLARSPLRDRIEHGVSTLAYGVFVPVFFVNVGLGADLGQLVGRGLWLTLALIAVAVVSKVVGAGLGARLAGLSGRESIQLGVGMMSRGEVGLIVATLGVAEGIIDAEVFGAVVGIVIATTLLTPPLLRSLFVRPAAAGAAQQLGE